MKSAILDLLPKLSYSHLLDIYSYKQLQHDAEAQIDVQLSTSPRSETETPHFLENGWATHNLCILAIPTNVFRHSTSSKAGSSAASTPSRIPFRIHALAGANEVSCVSSTHVNIALALAFIDCLSPALSILRIHVASWVPCSHFSGAEISTMKLEAHDANGRMSSWSNFLPSGPSKSRPSLSFSNEMRISQNARETLPLPAWKLRAARATTHEAGT